MEMERFDRVHPLFDFDLGTPCNAPNSFMSESRENLLEPPVASDKIQAIVEESDIKVLFVPSYERYPGCETDALRLPEPGEPKFGGCVPADVNKARCDGL
jgi:hypothetical protein